MQHLEAKERHDGEFLKAQSHLRQFVPPRLLVTNSRSDNQEPMNMESIEAQIRGVVISRHHQLANALQS